MFSIPQLNKWTTQYIEPLQFSKEQPPKLHLLYLLRSAHNLIHFPLRRIANGKAYHMIASL